MISFGGVLSSKAFIKASESRENIKTMRIKAFFMQNRAGIVAIEIERLIDGGKMVGKENECAH